MSSELEQTRAIAERVARRLSVEPGNQPIPPSTSSRSDVTNELAAMRSGLSELQKRLAQIEAKVRADVHQAGKPDLYASAPSHQTTRPIPLTHSPWLVSLNASVGHPSQERFGVEEATVSELVDYFEKEKTCSVEPGGKPCDHCAMCSSRGF